MTLKALRNLAHFPTALNLLIVGLLEVGYIALSLAIQAFLPSDGVLLTELAPSGLSVANVLLPSQESLRVGDRILAIDGRDIWEWVGRAVTGGSPAVWQVGQTITYRLLRDGETIEVPVLLKPFPVGRLPATRLGVYMLLLLSLATGGYVVFARPEEISARLLFLTSLGLIFPLTLHFQTAILVTPALFIAENVVKFLGRTLMLSALLHLFLVFPIVKRRLRDPVYGSKRGLRVLHFVNPLLSILIGWVFGRTPAQKLALAWQSASWIGLLMLVGSIVSVIHTYVTVRQVTVRSQIRWVAWGSAMGLLPYVLLTALPEVVTGRPWLTIEVTAFCIIALPVALAVAIARYRLFDIDILIRRGLLYTSFAILLAFVYLGLTAALNSGARWLTGRPNPGLTTFVATLTVSTLFWVFQRQATRIVTRVLYPNYVDPNLLLAQVSEKLSSAIRQEEVEALLVQIIPAQIGSRQGGLHVPNEGTIRLDTAEGRAQLTAWEKIWDPWREHGAAPLTCAMLPSWVPADAVHQIVGTDVELLLPLVVGEQMVGLWALRSRASGLPYNSTEVRVLNTLARQAAISLQNARLVGQLEMQSQWLIQEVRHRTLDLEDERNRLQVILQNMADGLLVTGAAGQVLLVNAAFERLTHTLMRAIVGRSLKRTFDSPELAMLIERAAHEPGQVFSESFDWQNRVFYASTSALRDGSSVITVLRDITREAEIDRIKSEFISTVSHEFRTPLTSILGFAKLAGKAIDRTLIPAISSDDHAAKIAVRVIENMNIIVSESERLTRLINDMLDIARIDDGKMEWHDQPILIHESVQQAIQPLAAQAQEKGLSLHNNVPTGLPPFLADPDRIRQVLTNLIANSIKFTHQGDIRINARLLPPGANLRDWQPPAPTIPALLVSVHDTGIGIAPQDLPRLFSRFQQVAGDGLTDKPQGTGLGLAICREIVTHYGGIIWAESTPGQGSSFSFALPLSPR